MVEPQEDSVSQGIVPVTPVGITDQENIDPVTVEESPILVENPVQIACEVGVVVNIGIGFTTKL